MPRQRLHLRDVSLDAHGATVSLNNLGRVVAFVGDNGTGKTTILQAPSLLRPKTPQGSAGFGSEDFDLAAGIFGDDPDPVLEIRRQRSGGKHGIWLDPRKKGTATANIAQIHAALGDAAAFSMADLMGMSADKAARWLEERVLASGDDDLADQIGEERIAQVQKILGDASPLKPGWVVSRDDLARAVDMLWTARNDANRDVQRLRKALDQAEVDQKTADLPPGTVASWRTKVKESTDRISEIDQMIARAEGEASGRAAIERQITYSMDRLKLLREIDPDAIALEWEEKIRAARQVVENHIEARDKHRLRMEAAQAAEESTQQDLAHARAEQATLTESGAANLAEMSAGERCDRCGRIMDTDAAGHLHDLIAEYRRKLGELAQQLDEAENHHTAARLNRIEMQDFAEHARKELAKAEEALSGLKQSRDMAVDRARKDVAGIDDLAKETEKLRSEMPEQAGGLEALRRERETMDRQRREAQANADTINDWEGRRSDYHRMLSEQEKAEEDRTRAFALWGEMGSNGILGRVLSDSLLPLVTDASKYVEAVLGDPLWANAEGGFTWGLYRSGEQVPIDQASRSERTVAVTFMAIAIMGRMDGWRFLTIDDLENLSGYDPDEEVDAQDGGGTRRTLFAESLAQAVDDEVLDGAWIACVEDGTWCPPHPFQVINLPLGGVSNGG